MLLLLTCVFDQLLTAVSLFNKICAVAKLKVIGSFPQAT